MHQNFQTGRRPEARVVFPFLFPFLVIFCVCFTRGGGDAPAGLWALCPGRGRSWSRRAAPGSPSLQTARSPPLRPPPTHGEPLSQLLTAPSPSEYPPLPVCRMRLPLAPRRQSSPNYRCKVIRSSTRLSTSSPG